MDPALLEFVSGDQVDLQAIPVYHSFGRGCWKELAEKVHLPRDALESAMEQQSSRVRDPGEEVGGAASRMGGVRSESASQPSKPKASGRARALKLRGSVFVRRPGGLRFEGVRTVSHS